MPGWACGVKSRLFRLGHTNHPKQPSAWTVGVLQQTLTEVDSKTIAIVIYSLTPQLFHANRNITLILPQSTAVPSSNEQFA